MRRNFDSVYITSTKVSMAWQWPAGVGRKKNAGSQSEVGGKKPRRKNGLSGVLRGNRVTTHGSIVCPYRGRMVCIHVKCTISRATTLDSKLLTRNVPAFVIYIYTYTQHFLWGTSNVCLMLVSLVYISQSLCCHVSRLQLSTIQKS